MSETKPETDIRIENAIVTGTIEDVYGPEAFEPTEGNEA